MAIEIPKTVEETLAIDRKNRTKFWEDAIRMEIENVGVAFRDLHQDEKAPVGYQFVK
jgi:hypothetical protein